MELFAPPVERLIEEFAKLPGILRGNLQCFGGAIYPLPVPKLVLGQQRQHTNQFFLSDDFAIHKTFKPSDTFIYFFFC